MLKTEKPRKVHIDVTESGKKTADVRIPYSMFRLGLKYGRQAASEETDGCAQAMAQMKDFDCAVFERAVSAKEISLPHLLLEMADEKSATHVVVTAER